MTEKKPKRPRDPSQLAKMMIDVATGNKKDTITSESSPRRGQIGGRKGGKTRAMQMTSEQRSEAAKIAASARWRKK